MLEKEKDQLIMEYARLAVEAQQAGTAVPTQIMMDIAKKLAMPHKEIILAAATKVIKP